MSLIIGCLEFTDAKPNMSGSPIASIDILDTFETISCTINTKDAKAIIAHLQSQFNLNP